MIRGARVVHPDASFVLRPSADGGEGTLDAFVLALGGRVRVVRVTGPLGGHVDAQVALIEGDTAVIEMATASGLSLVTGPPDPLNAHTYGTGELIAAASEIPEVQRIVVGVGGSASTDGGTGAARALGWRFLDAAGKELELGGGHLVDLARIEGPPSRSQVAVTAACDVDNPLLGANGAARVFSAQKGATREDIERLEQGLDVLAQVLRRDVGVDVATIASGGAGGGLGAGLFAFFGANLRPGLDLLAEMSGLEDDIRTSDLVITGEGRMDRASLGGKAPIAIARLAQLHDKPCVVVAGDLQLERQELRRNGIGTAVGLLQSGGSALADTDPDAAVAKAVEGALRMRLERKEGRPLRRR
jgi:glycerate kinase